ncbi:MAG: hypothetical protein FWD40_01040 [Treponema sp.]|nr:hypothetical protein [Treponema sp.]
MVTFVEAAVMHGDIGLFLSLNFCLSKEKNSKNMTQKDSFVILLSRRLSGKLGRGEQIDFSPLESITVRL